MRSEPLLLVRMHKKWCESCTSGSTPVLIQIRLFRIAKLHFIRTSLDSRNVFPNKKALHESEIRFSSVVLTLLNNCRNSVKDAWSGVCRLSSCYIWPVIRMDHFNWIQGIILGNSGPGNGVKMMEHNKQEQPVVVLVNNLYHNSQKWKKTMKNLVGGGVKTYFFHSFADHRYFNLFFSFLLFICAPFPKLRDRYKTQPNLQISETNF